MVLAVSVQSLLVWPNRQVVSLTHPNNRDHALLEALEPALKGILAADILEVVNIHEPSCASSSALHYSDIYTIYTRTGSCQYSGTIVRL